MNALKSKSVIESKFNLKRSLMFSFNGRIEHYVDYKVDVSMNCGILYKPVMTMQVFVVPISVIHCLYLLKVTGEVTLMIREMHVDPYSHY
jgi:hypothetical protein